MESIKNILCGNLVVVFFQATKKMSFLEREEKWKINTTINVAKFFLRKQLYFIPHETRSKKFWVCESQGTCFFIHFFLVPWERYSGVFLENLRMEEKKTKRFWSLIQSHHFSLFYCIFFSEHVFSHLCNILFWKSGFGFE